MAISINSNFSLLSKTFLDSRQSFETLVDMASFLEGAIPEGFLTYNKETDKFYKFNASNTVDPTLGKWREFSSGSGENVIDDTLETSLTKTYSIDKIKELMSKQGGVVPVDQLPVDFSTVELSKIYLVPNADGADDNLKDEYVCVHTEARPAVYREALVTSDVDFDAYKAEIEAYVLGGGSIDDDFATYVGVNTTTAMTEEVYAEMVESINASDADFTTYQDRVTAEVLVPEVQEAFAWEKIGTRNTSGSVEWAEDIIVNNPMGKVVDGTNLNGKSVLDIVAKMLTVAQATTVNLVGNPTTSGILEKAVASIADVTLTATINLGTCTIADGTPVVFKKDGIEIGREEFVNGTNEYTYADNGANLVDDAKYSVEVEYDNDGVVATAKKEIKYEFEYPMFYGTSATKEIADVTALTKVLSVETKQTLSFTCQDGFCVFAVPDVKTITNIKDQNSFDNFSDFSYVTQVVTLGTEQVVYKVYTNSMAVSCNNFKYQFTLA